ncbi:MAG: signal peptidase I [Microthrixaceae bacterium]
MTDQAPPGASVPAPPPPAPVSRRRRSSSGTRNVVEWIVVVVGAVVVALLVKTFLVQAFRIPSESMDPTLQVGDRVLVNKLSYRLHDVNRGDVVVFTRPANLPEGPDQPDDLIKRVIGLPGDTVQAKDGKVYVNGRPLDEPYLPDGTTTQNLENPVKVPEGEVLVLGDNRSNSADGRVFGTISEDTIIGRAFVIVWPLSRFGGL